MGPAAETRSTDLRNIYLPVNRPGWCWFKAKKSEGTQILDQQTVDFGNVLILEHVGTTDGFILVRCKKKLATYIWYTWVCEWIIVVTCSYTRQADCLIRQASRAYKLCGLGRKDES